MCICHCCKMSAPGHHTLQTISNKDTRWLKILRATLSQNECNSAETLIMYLCTWWSEPSPRSLRPMNSFIYLPSCKGPQPKDLRRGMIRSCRALHALNVRRGQPHSSNDNLHHVDVLNIFISMSKVLIKQIASAVKSNDEQCNQTCTSLTRTLLGWGCLDAAAYFFFAKGRVTLDPCAK